MLAQPHHQEDALSYTYVLHVWREHPHAPWRASLRARDGEQRMGFADLEQLAIFLLGLTEQRTPPDLRTRSDRLGDDCC